MVETRVERRSRMLLGLPVPELPPSIAVLSEPHRRVIDAWFANGCRSRRGAMIEAGMSPSSTHSVFIRPEVKKEIDRCRDRLDYRAAVTAERIEQELAKIAFASLGDLLEIQEDGSAWIDMSAITEDQKSALAEYNVETYKELGNDDEPGREVKKAKIKFHDKKAALDSLARIRGMFKDKLEVSVGLTLSDKVQQARMRLAEPKIIEGEIIP